MFCGLGDGHIFGGTANQLTIASTGDFLKM